MTNAELTAKLLRLLSQQYIGSYFNIDGTEYLFDITRDGTIEYILDRVQGDAYSVRAGTLHKLAAKFVHQVHPTTI